ncbi:MAG: hypothetical protein ABFC34_08200 [Methanobacterium sp.]
MDWRNDITYGATKFEEHYWGSGNVIYSFSRGEGIYNYIDSEVFYKEFSYDDYGGEGFEEYNMGGLIGFVMELLGKISNEIHNPNLCHIKMKSLRHFKTNEDFLNLIEEWAKEYGLSCNEKIYRDEYLELHTQDTNYSVIFIQLEYFSLTTSICYIALIHIFSKVGIHYRWKYDRSV